MIKQESEEIYRIQKADIPDGKAILDLNRIELEKYTNDIIYKDIKWLEKILRRELNNENINIELLGIESPIQHLIKPIQLSYMSRVKVSINGVEGYLYGIPDLQRGMFLVNRKPKVYRNIIEKSVGLYTTKDSIYQLKTEQSSLTFIFSDEKNMFYMQGKRKSKINLIDVLVNEFYKQGYFNNDKSFKQINKVIYDHFESPYIRSCMYSPDRLLETYISIANRNIIGDLEDHTISKKARTKLSEKINFNKFIGEQLITGEIITEDYLAKLPNDVNRLTIKHKTNLKGFILAQELNIDYIKAGSKISELIREHLKISGISSDIYNCEYAPEDIDLKERKYILNDGTIITDYISDLINSLDLDYIYIRRNKKSLQVKYEFKKEIYKFVDNGKTNLELDDLLAIISYVIGVKENPERYILYNRDDNFEKDILTFSGMYSKYFRKAIIDLLNNRITKVRESFLSIINDGVDTYIELAKQISKRMNEYFGPSGDNLIQHCEAICPVDLLSSINGVIPSHLNSVSNTSKKERGFSPNTIGVIDPLDTPQGKRLGLVEQLTIYAKTIDEDIEIPMRKIINGKVSSNVEMIPLDFLSDKTYTTLDELEFENPYDPFNSSIITKWCHAITPSHTKEDSTELVAMYVPIYKVEYVLAYYDSICSVATGLIPMLGNIDGARGTFGAAMMKQTVPLVNPEKPKVYTPLYKQINDILELSKYSPIDGKVIMTNAYYIRIVSDDGNSVDINLKDTLPKSQVNLSYDILVELGQEIKKGDIVAQSKFTKDGVYAPGRNVFVAYMPLYGNNYDDSIAIRNGCANLFKSISINYVETNYNAFSKVKLDKPPYLGKWVGNGDTIATVVINGSRRKKLKASNSKCGRVESLFREPVDENNNRYVAKLVDIAATIPGDKKAGFFGNKGTISKVYPDYDMPKFKNGVLIDIAQNSHGVPSRMNPGQISIGHLGFCAYLLDIEFITQPYGGASYKEIYELLEYLYYIANDMVSEAENMDSIPQFIKDRALYRKNKIKAWKGCFDKSGNAILIDPITGEEFKTPITFGYTYYLKLMHQVDHKMNIRGFENEKYLASTGLPTKSLGKEGGQTIGEMEMQAILAHGAVNLFQEVIHLKSGNLEQRTKFIDNFQNKFVDAELPEMLKEDLNNPRIQSQILGYYLNGIGINIESDDSNTIFGKKDFSSDIDNTEVSREEFIDDLLGGL